VFPVPALHFANHDVQKPGRPADVLVARTPGPREGQPRRLRAGADYSVNATVHASKLARGVRRQSADDESLVVLPGALITLKSLTVKALEGLTVSARSRAGKKMFSLGLLSWLYQPPDRDDAHLHLAASSPAHPTWRRPRHCVQRPVETSARDESEDVHRRYEVKPAHDAGRPLRNITATRRGPTPGSRPATAPGFRRCSSAHTR